MVVRLKRLPRTIVRGAIEAPSFVMGTFAALRDYLVTQPIVGIMAGLAALLFTLFFVMLGSLSPNSPGQSVGLGAVLNAAQQRQIASATIRDEDARVEVTNRAGQHFRAAHPRPEGATSRMIDAVQKSGTNLPVDPQAGNA